LTGESDSTKLVIRLKIGELKYKMNRVLNTIIIISATGISLSLLLDLLLGIPKAPA
jgi:hypothetical protein